MVVWGRPESIGTWSRSWCVRPAPRRRRTTYERRRGLRMRRVARRASLRIMHARAIDDAGERLRELRREEWQDLALAGVALGLALAATQGAQTLAVPLLVGGLSLGALG